MSKAFECDVAGVRNFAGDVFLSCRRGSDWFSAMAMDVLNIEGVLKEVEETLHTEDLSMSRHEVLTALIFQARKTLGQIQALVLQHSSTDTQTRQAREISENGKSEVARMKWNLIHDHKSLKEFLSTYQIVVERTLKELAKDHKRGLHPASVLCSVTAFESLTSKDSNTWDAIYEDLERIKISREAFDINQAFILKWFEKECMNGTFRDPRSPDAEYRMETQTILADATHRADVRLKRSPLPTNPPHQDTTTTIDTLVSPQLESQSIEIQQDGDRLDDSELPQILRKEPPEERLPQSIRIEPNEERSDIVELPQSINSQDLQPRESSAPRKVTPQSTSFWATNQDKALRSALFRHNFDKAGRSLDKGANIDAVYTPSEGLPETPLIHYLNTQNLPVVKWLLKEGANPGNTDWVWGKWTFGSLLPRVLSKKFDERREGPNFEIAQALLDYGAEIDRIGSLNSYCIHSALYAAVVHKKIEVVRWLLDRGASFCIQESRAQDDIGLDRHLYAQHETAFHAAARVKNVEMLQLFLDRGAKIDMLNGSGQSALHTAVLHALSEWGSTVCTETTMTWLLDHGAEVNLHDSDNKSPLFYAASNHNKANAVRLLIRRGASVKNIKKMAGMSAIRYALSGAYDDVALAFLTNQPGDLRYLDDYGHTLLHIAALGACTKSYRRLIALGVSRETRNLRGNTAYQEARDYFERGSFAQFGRRGVPPSGMVQDRMQMFLINAHRSVEQGLVL